MPGYSRTPLWKKLGYRTGTAAWISGAPANYEELIDLPRDFEISWLKRARKGLGFAHVFAIHAAKLTQRLTMLRKTIAPDGFVWVSWPKRSSGVATDIAEGRVRDVALPMGFVDIKVCAVDETWSGLKLVIRKSER